MSAKREHDDSGKFARKGDEERAVRSIRLTDSTWHTLGNRAEEQDMTRADYLEALCLGEIDWESEDSESHEKELDFDPYEVAEILKNALTLNRRGNITKQLIAIIEEALELMGYEWEGED